MASIPPQRAKSSSIRTTVYTLLAASVIPCLNSCRDTDTDKALLPVLNDIVELNEMDNGRTIFHLYQPDSSTPITLTCNNEIIDTTAIHVGQSLLLAYRYTNQNPTTSLQSGEITPTGYARITNLTLMQADKDGLYGWDSDPVYLQSIWRAGQRVNLRLTLTYDPQPRHFAIIIDKNTMNDAIPTAYLFNSRKSTSPNFTRQYYVSCNLSPIFSHTGVTALRLIVNNSNTTSGLPTPSEYIITRP